MFEKGTNNQRKERKPSCPCCCVKLSISRGSSSAIFQENVLKNVFKNSSTKNQLSTESFFLIYTFFCCCLNLTQSSTSLIKCLIWCDCKCSVGSFSLGNSRFHFASAFLLNRITRRRCWGCSCGFCFRWAAAFRIFVWVGTDRVGLFISNSISRWDGCRHWSCTFYMRRLSRSRPSARYPRWMRIGCSGSHS